MRVRSGEGIVGRVAETGEPMLGRRADADVRPLTPEPYANTYVAVPFKSTGRFLGVLVLTDRLGGDDFDDANLETLRSFASQAAVAVDNVQLHEEAQRLSLTDGLTGLWNYRYFQMNFAKEIERASRFSRPLALLMLDIDRFKEVNDTYGHQRGDAVLVELSRRISAEIREVDLLARYGGEEIVLVLPETDEAGARHTAERICDVVRRAAVRVPGNGGIPITVSVGIAVFPQHGTSVTTLVERADDALYAAKSAGRDTWRMAEENGSVRV
jgi:diguanylate cyclase (GGDEF)-like protein